jgi:hypothetical protein
MTEDEAKTKWCPFVRSTVVGLDDAGKITVVSNRDAAQLVQVDDIKVMTHNCIGSACMAWRNVLGPDPRDADRTMPEGTMSRVIVVGGYCGLAGTQ